MIGASRTHQSIGYRLLDAVRSNKFHGRCYAINPHASTIAGMDAYPSLRALPEPVDLAVIVVPKEVVLSVIDDCAATGVRALVVITAGFAEVGEEGRRLQDQLLEKVRQHGIRMVGPNCFGILNTDPAVRLNATFTSTSPLPGAIAMSSQSGALGLALLAASERLQLGISTFVSVGNKADVSVNDLLQYWESDPATKVILLYVESFGNPRRFARIARRVSREKPIVALKAGRTSSGKRAAGSHTAALASNEVAVEALFQQTGILRADTLEDMFALAAGLSEQPLPKGKRVGILTNAGGPAILCADACEAGGLEVPELSQDTIARLSPFLPTSAALHNPVDMTRLGHTGAIRAGHRHAPDIRRHRRPHYSLHCCDCHGRRSHRGWDSQRHGRGAGNGMDKETGLHRVDGGNGSRAEIFTPERNYSHLRIA